MVFLSKPQAPQIERNTTVAAALSLIESQQIENFRRNQKVKLISEAVESMDNEGNVVSTGCGICSLLFGRKQQQSSVSTSSRLQVACSNMEKRTETLRERVASARKEAKTLNSAGKKTEALAVLRRSKPLEKQLLASEAAQSTLDNQILMLEEASLQREISSALSQSVKTVKKKTKGLLDKTEKAVDGAADVRDLAEDVGGALQGLSTTDAPDDDELLAELEALGRADDDDNSGGTAERAAELDKREKQIADREEKTRLDREAALEALRDNFPKAPSSVPRKTSKNITTKKEEKSSLLASV
tara:strand:- start:77 stop:979 length:903 start_codon:yes stop_codon:yes gene_type:complete